MGYKYMQVAPVEDGENFSFAWEVSDTLAAPGNGDWYLVPRGINILLFTLSFPVAGTAKIQITTDTVAEVKAGTATGEDWAKGDVTATSQDGCNAVTAFRQVNTAGTSKMAVRGF